MSYVFQGAAPSAPPNLAFNYNTAAKWLLIGLAGFWLFSQEERSNPGRRRKRRNDPRLSRKIMGFSEGEPLTAEKLKERRRELALKAHPDRGGDLRQMQDLNAAADELLAQLQGGYDWERRAARERRAQDATKDYRSEWAAEIRRRRQAQERREQREQEERERRAREMRYSVQAQKAREERERRAAAKAAKPKKAPAPRKKPAKAPRKKSKKSSGCQCYLCQQKRKKAKR